MDRPGEHKGQLGKKKKQQPNSTERTLSTHAQKMMSTTMCGELYGQTSICTMIRGQRENSPSACGPVTVIHQRKEGRGYHKEFNCRFIQ